MWVDEIMSVIRKGPQLASNLGAMKINTKSVAKGANDSTFQFACLISDSIPIDIANTMAATLDRVYASFTQTWLSLHPTIDITIDTNPVQYLKRYHQNLRYESVAQELAVTNQTDIDRYMEGVEDGTYKLYTNPSKTFAIMFNVADTPTKEMLESNQKFMEEYMSEFDMTSFADAKKLNFVTEADSDFTSSGDMTQALINGQMKDYQNRQRNDIIQQSDKMKSPQMVDRELKRTNNMTPYGIQCHLMAVNDKGEFVQYMDFIVGVKAVMHLVKSDEVITNIVNVLQNRSVFFKMLKWTSGEISLFKNIILDLDTLRFDATPMTSGRSSWFSALKRLKNQKIGLHSGTVPHGIVPNATMVISSYENEYISQKLGFDLKNPRIASKIISGLFLMTFVIVDEGTGTVDILYDGSTSFETYALETLEKENSMNSNKLGREIGRMISH